MFSKVDKPHKPWDQNRPIKFFLFQRRKSYLYFTPVPRFISKKSSVCSWAKGRRRRVFLRFWWFLLKINSNAEFSRNFMAFIQLFHRVHVSWCRQWKLESPQGHLTMTATLSWDPRILMTLFNFGLSFWLWKSMNQQLRKSVNVAQKKRRSV